MIVKTLSRQTKVIKQESTMGKCNFLFLFEYSCLCCVCIAVLCEAAILPKCEDLAIVPPCLYKGIAPQPVCEGSQATVNIVFKLPQSVLQMIPPENTSALHLDKTITQGTELKDFLSNAENRDRWEIAILYKAELLEIQVTNNFIQKGDSFTSQFVLDMGSDILAETSPSVWFIIKDCDNQQTTATASTNTSPGKDTLNEKLILHTLAAVQGLLESRNLAEMENSSTTHRDRRYSDIDSTRLYRIMRVDVAFSVIGVILISYTAWLTTMSSYCSWKKSHKKQKGISPQRSVPLTTDSNAGNEEERNVEARHRKRYISKPNKGEIS